MSELLSRNGMVATQLARRLLGLELGGKLPRVRDLAASLGVGNGTIQAGLQVLEQVGAIEVIARGSLGTFLVTANRSQLWELAGLGSLTVALPLPYSRRYEGLATGIRDALAELSIPFSISYIRGSVERLNAVVSGAIDIAVVSGLAFDLLSAELPIMSLADLGPRTYVGSHGIVLAPGSTIEGNALKVAIDRTSADQVHLVESLFADRNDVEFFETSYHQLSREFAQQIVNATVWNLDELEERFAAPVEVLPLPPSAGIGRNTNAVLAIREGNERIPRVLFETLDLALIKQVQKDVISGSRIPSY